jgi:hypothetical protein
VAADVRRHYRVLPLKSISAVGLLAVTALGVHAADPYKTLPEVGIVNTAIDREGASTVLWDRLFANARGQAFGTLLAKIEGGDPAWIHVAARLRSASDAGVSLMLDQAMTLALPKAPAAVLKRIASDDGPSSFSVTAICSGAAFLDDEPKKKVLAWYERTERSLIELQDVSLDAKRVKCLSELRKGHRSYSARKAADQ